DTDQWEYTDVEIENLRNAFETTWPQAIGDMTAGRVAFENHTVVSDEPVTSLGYGGDMIEPENVPGWETLESPTAPHDSIYVTTPRPQYAIWTLSRMTENPVAVWVSFGYETEFDADGSNIAGWHWGFISTMGEMFYRDVMGLENVPEMEEAEQFGYAEGQEGIPFWGAWYRDYINRNIRDENNAAWGLGEPAWQLGTLRDWAAESAATSL
ncbi:MAG: hypothetical protein JXX29_11620, partial [Deltaproteobacteria bacterium]|nr:hypothetical protein [Deltaproteobacteria bacterium]MBN2672321.1 hypothetical protein [Deltaproteobacteria bacterium]